MSPSLLHRRSSGGVRAAGEGQRTTVRPTTFGIVVAVLLVVSAILRPAVADPSVVGLVWAGLAGALVFGVVWPVLTVRNLGVRIVAAPTDLVVDQLGSIEVELRGRASGLSLGCTGQAMKVLDVVSPGSVRLPFTITRRGSYGRIRVDLGSDAPFGVVAVTRTRLLELPRELLVGPRPVPEQASVGDHAGDHTAPVRSGASPRGDEVRSVRAYVTGDPSHLVHWPSSARTGTLVVRELQPPAAEAIAIVLDLGVHDPANATSGGVEDEHAAGRAAGLAASALARGARVMLCTAESQGPVSGEVADELAVRRRLARATSGAPARPAAHWPVVRVAVGPNDTIRTEPASNGDAADRERARRTTRHRVSPDRRTISNLRTWALTVLVGVQLWSALSALTGDGERNLAAEGATVSAVLVMFGLRSVPIRWLVRGVTVVSVMVLARFGELDLEGGLGGSWRVLLWLGATAAALVLAPSSRSAAGRELGLVVNQLELPDPLRARAAPSSASSDPEGTRRGPGVPVADPHTAARVPAALMVGTIALVGASALLVGPRVANGFPVGSKAGDIVDFGDNRAQNALAARETLDMTSRPRLSEEVVMSVRSPLVSFWRTEVFDVWDGSTWSRSRPREGSMVTDGRVVPDEFDLAAEQGRETTQEFRLEAGFATAVPVAPSPVQVDAGTELLQRADGTLSSPFEPLGRGSTYTVESRQIAVDAEALRATSRDDVPSAVRERYARPAVATDRVVDLARRVTSAAANDYDRVLAIEGWMNDNTEYSLDAPLSPEGVDVVDHFLFSERLGWCEQIASSLVVMARSVGVPARLATGFAPGEWDPVGGRFVVRERDAHAWAEVWFPGAGWVPFDPTASVPLSGTEEATAGAAARDWREIGGAALVVVAAAALGGGWIRRWWARRREQRRGRRRLERLARERWDVAEERRLEDLGEAAGRPRAPEETATAYGSALATLTGDAGLAVVGAQVDRARYSAGGPDEPATVTSDGTSR